MVCRQKARTGSVPAGQSEDLRRAASTNFNSGVEVMNAAYAATWMLAAMERDGCIYQDDVVDYLVKADAAALLRENSEGNLVVGKQVLDAFKKTTEATVVWVKPDRYWRWRVAEDEPGREARG
jgi:hypothetical protein